jgi:hypothetical protein
MAVSNRIPPFTSGWLDCGMPFGIRTCWFCLPCEIECPEEALYVEIPYRL